MINFFIIEWDALLMYHMFDYKIQKLKGHNKQKSEELRISFYTKFENLLIIFFLLSKGMHFLCATSLIISYKNQPLLLS